MFHHLVGTGIHLPPDLDLVLFNITQPLFLEATMNGEVLLPRKLLVLNQDTASGSNFLLESYGQRQRSRHNQHRGGDLWRQRRILAGSAGVVPSRGPDEVQA